MSIYSRVRIFVALAIIGASAFQSRAQQAPAQQGGVIRINVSLVQVDAVVTDRKGKPVTDLKSEDFELFQDGQPQKITNFEYISVRNPAAKPTNIIAIKPRDGVVPPPPPPITVRPDQIHRTLAMVVDDLGLSFDSIIPVRNSLKKWVDTEMQPGDLVAIIRTAAGMGSLQQFTTDKKALYNAIDKIQFHLGRVGVSSFKPQVGAMPTDGVLDTSVFDDEVQAAYLQGTLSAIQYVVRGLRDFPGRKSVILFSESMRFTYVDGPGIVRSTALIDATREDRLRKVADEANRSSVVIYAVDPRGVIFTGITAEDNTGGLTDEQLGAINGDRQDQLTQSRDGMYDLTHRTGGLFVHDNNDVGELLREAVDDGDGYYLLGYQPVSDTFSEDAGKANFHSIKVSVKRPGLNVRSRSGFLGTPDNKSLSAPEERRAQLANALLSPFATGDIRVNLTGIFQPSEDEAGLIRALMYFDARDVTFTEQPDGARTGEIDLVAMTFDADGQQVDTIAQTTKINLPKEIYPQIMKNGLVYSLDLPVKKAGGYQLRTVLRDKATSRLGSATQFVEVPDVKNGRLTLSTIVLAPAKLPTAPPPNVVEIPEAKSIPDATPAFRVFKPGSAIVYGFEVLNAKTDAEKKTQLDTQLRLFKDGQQIYNGNAQGVSGGQVANAKRLAVNGRIQLATLAPGNYVLQIIVADNNRFDKYRMAAQAIDFEVQ